MQMREVFDAQVPTRLEIPPRVGVEQVQREEHGRPILPTWHLQPDDISKSVPGLRLICGPPERQKETQHLKVFPDGLREPSSVVRGVQP